MKKAILLSTLFLTLLAGACGNSGNNHNASTVDSMHPLDTTGLAKGAMFYQCPMHTEITSEKPGACPKCGMDLTKTEKK